MGDEEIAEYALALRELKVNSKPVITSLTMLAGEIAGGDAGAAATVCLLYTSPSPRDRSLSRMPSSA